MKRALLAIAIVFSCTPAEHRDAREKYNAGVDALAKGDFDAAEKALLDARSNAGVDPELRFRAAYDLGLAYASHADKLKTGKDPDLTKALALEQQAVSWFSDAAQLRKDDADTQSNLATVRARAAALADEINRGQNKLEARLEAVIDSQRKLLDEARRAWAAIKQTGGADPMAQSTALTKLADDERGIVAEAGVIGDLASDEIDSIGKKPADKRTQEESVRVVQLKNLDLYLEGGRTKIAEARRKLQDFDAEHGVSSAEAALVALKRAREQLLDPVTVMREVARDQVELLQQTTAVAQVESKPVLTMGSAAAEAPVIPGWLEPPALGEREGTLHDRLDEIRMRVQAGVDNADKGSAAPKPEEAKALDHFKIALPHVTAATDAMTHAKDSLASAQLPDAQKSERQALDELAKAIEEFADLKQTIELAYATQQQLVGLLSPEGDTKLPPAERAQDTNDALDGNLARVDRIKQQLVDETAKIDEQAKQVDAKLAEAANGTGSAAPDPKQLEAAKQQAQQQIDQAKQQMAQAEQLRGEAAAALAELPGAIKASKDPLAKAKLAEDKLAELRKLFFSVIEHLQELIREQGETRDATAKADTEDDFTREPEIPTLVKDQDQHSQMAQAITDALAKQADAAQKQPQQQGHGQGPDPKALAGAADEVRQAKIEMTGAKSTLDKAAAKTASVKLAPAVDSQAKAIEHLKKALELLQPPKQNKNDQKDQQQQQQQQQQQKQQQQQQQGGAGQRARDEDAKRQREKQQHGQSEPVDQDW
ncbi:MAG TPA: hypothetical protein VGG28_22855 [Kofleriaceae bacterium]